jgi:uncharacterized protein YlzI (FlbEa/FlbD family)
MTISEQSLAVELMEMEAWADLMEAMPDETMALIEGDCSVVADSLSVSARKIPLVTFNRVMGLGLSQRADIAALEAIGAHMRKASAPVAQLQIAPYVLTPNLEHELEAAGFARSGTTWAKMGRSTDTPPKIDTALRIVAAGPERANAFAQVVVSGFGMPPFFVPWLAALPGRERWRCYLAEADGEVVAGAAMYVGVDSVWLGIAATIASARKHGAQSALLARRVADAAELGKPWAYTETGILEGPNPSLANMYRTGFECLHERTNWTLNG